MKKRLVIIAAFTLAVCLLAACGTKGPSGKVINELIQSNNLNVLSNAYTDYYGDPIVFNIENVDIELQQDNDKQSTVKCKISLDNADYSATVYYTLDLVYYDKGGWVLNNVYEYNDYDLYPKHEYDESEGYPRDPNKPMDLMVNYLEGIHMPYDMIDASAPDDFDLSSETEICYHLEYTGESQTCAYIGSADAYYSFNKRSGQWELSDFDTSPGYDITDWYLDKSIKCADWVNGVVYMRISDVDMLNHTATVEYYHTSEYHDNHGVIQSTQVTFTRSQDKTSLYFSPIAVYYDYGAISLPYTKYYYIRVEPRGFAYFTANIVHNDLNYIWDAIGYGDKIEIVDNF